MKRRRKERWRKRGAPSNVLIAAFSPITVVAAALFALRAPLPPLAPSAPFHLSDLFRYRLTRLFLLSIPIDQKCPAKTLVSKRTRGPRCPRQPSLPSLPSRVSFQSISSSILRRVPFFSPSFSREGQLSSRKEATRKLSEPRFPANRRFEIDKVRIEMENHAGRGELGLSGKRA